MPRVSAAQASLRLEAVVTLDDWVRALAWSPDGLEVAAACADGTVAAVDADGQLRSLQRHDAPATTVSWSSTGVLASGGEDGRVLIDGTPHELGAGWVEHVAWRPDGASLAAAHGRAVHVLGADGASLGVSAEFPATVACLDWHPRGVELAAGSYGGVHLLRGKDARTVRRLKWKGSVLAIAISPDGLRLAHGNQDASVHFWDLRRGSELEMWGYTTKVRQLAWRHDGRFLATGGGTAITIWNFAGRGPAGTRPQELDHHTEPITWLGFQPRSRLLASTAQDGFAALWKPGSDDLPLAVVAVDDELTTAAWSPDGNRLALGGANGSVAIARAERKEDDA
jgi:WD40 repeat protein